MVRYSFYDANCAAIESLPMGPCVYSVYDNMHVHVQNKHTIHNDNLCKISSTL